MNGKEDFDRIEREQYKNWYHLYYPMVRKLVLDNGGTKEDAEEIFQETLIGYFEKTRSSDFTLTSKPSTFIYAIALNKWRDYSRMKKSGKSASISNDLDLYTDLEVKEYDHEKDSIIAGLKKCIDSLSATHKKIVISFYYLKQSMKDIAEKFGFENDKSVKSQSWKAVQLLKKCIKIYQP